MPGSYDSPIWTPDRWPGLPHLLDVQQITREFLDHALVPLAEKFIRYLADPDGGQLNEYQFPKCRRREVYILFYEPSTRTSISFEDAVWKLGGHPVVRSDMTETSSAVKGESPRMTARTIRQNHPLAVVIRSKDPMIPFIFAREFEEYRGTNPHKDRYSVVFNAGNGADAHPTQALLDWFTLHHDYNGIDGKTMLVVGDVGRARTINSLLLLLSQVGRNVTVKLVLPRLPDFEPEPPQKLVRILERSPNVNVSFVPVRSHHDFVRTAVQADVIYSTRLQRERYPELAGTPDLERRLVDLIQVDCALLDQAGTPLFHPLPHQDEVAEEVEDHPLSVFEAQMSRGVPVRMALLWLLTQRLEHVKGLCKLD